MKVLNTSSTGDMDLAATNRQQVADIKKRYLNGFITREQAQAEAEPVIERINARQQEIARKFGKTNYPKTTFTGLMR
ncbi:MAG TPA: hypothetical protein VMB52_06260 [Verrucomicrobiae bacterium]|nr:hypothetical protein [Verrucomicrobiae bacterium]